jgi:predicted dehydrogenase
MRIAVIGTGYGEEHIVAFGALPGVEVVAVASASRDRAEAIGERHGIPVRATDYAEALAVDGLDAVCIATPPDLHREIALAAFERGCHVLSEKPLGVSAPDCEAMLDAASRSGLVHAVNYDWRPVPDFTKLHALLASGWIGEVQSVRLTWLAPWEAEAPFGWRHQRARCGMGVLGDQSHLIDDLLWNLGPLSRIAADLRTVATERRDRAGILRRCDAEDAAAFVAVTQSGVQVIGQCSRCAGDPGYRLAEYEGSGGSLRLHMPDPSDRDRSTLVGRRAGKGDVDLSEPAPAAESAQARFLRAIRDGTEPATTFADGLAVVRITDAMQASSDTGRWVAVGEDERSG